MKEKKRRRLRDYFGLPALLGSIGGAGTAYLAAQAGTVGYIAIREIYQFVFTHQLSPIPRF